MWEYIFKDSLHCSSCDTHTPHVTIIVLYENGSYDVFNVCKGCSPFQYSFSLEGQQTDIWTPVQL